VATVQRAASDEPRDSAKTQAVETPPRASPVPQATPPPPVSPPAPAAPRPAAPALPPAPGPAPPPTPAQANTALPSRAVEEVAARVEPDAARVLALAARTAGPDADARIRQGARAMRNVTNRPRPSSQSSTVGRQLNAQARAAWERQDVDAALRLQQRAFDAYPNDPEIAGNLAFYYLKVKPAQPGAARRLALYALGVRGNAFPAGRMQDWGTLAVASSLDGRKADATGALFVMLATSGSPERACRAALMAVAQYGPPMQSPANALLSRVRARGAATGAPSCR
jgi:hypothetical protein